MSCLWNNKDRQYDCKYCIAECDSRQDEFSGMMIDPSLKKHEPDEIDVWLQKEFGIFAGACSSIENLRYYTARQVAEKLWNKK